MLNVDLSVHRCGLTTSAFNMLPVGCLDGGRAMQVVALFVHFLNSFVSYLCKSSCRAGDLARRHYIDKIYLKYITAVYDLKYMILVTNNLF